MFSKSISVLLLCLVGISLVNSKMVDLCKTHECFMEVQVRTTDQSDYDTYTQHTLFDENSLHFANVTFHTGASNSTVSNKIMPTIGILNITEDPCMDGTCWMHLWSDSPITNFRLSGYYDYKGGNLLLYPSLTFDKSPHDTDLSYTASLLTCMFLNPEDYNVCMNSPGYKLIPFRHVNHC